MHPQKKRDTIWCLFTCFKQTKTNSILGTLFSGLTALKRASGIGYQTTELAASHGQASTSILAALLVYLLFQDYHRFSLKK